MPRLLILNNRCEHNTRVRHRSFKKLPESARVGWTYCRGCYRKKREATNPRLKIRKVTMYCDDCEGNLRYCLERFNFTGNSIKKINLTNFKIEIIWSKGLFFVSDHLFCVLSLFVSIVWFDFFLVNTLFCHQLFHFSNLHKILFLTIHSMALAITM